MKPQNPTTASRRRLDQALKTAFDAKTKEPVPEHLIELAHDLDAPNTPRTKAG